jgi:hypothetical protein
MSSNIEAAVARIASDNGVPRDAVETALSALRRGGGTMAQFSHPAFGGMAQWSPGMCMVGDMFNDRMRATLDSVCSALTEELKHSQTSAQSGPMDASLPAHSPAKGWWPEGLGLPSATGAQNEMRYAAFPETRRLAVDDNGRVTIYDTGEHRIYGVSQAQSGSQGLSFVSQLGDINLSALKVAGAMKST